MHLTVFMDKIREVFVSVVPITVIVLILSFTLTPMSGSMIARFLLGAVLIIAGLSVFLLGVDLGVTPIGTLMGSMITKSNKFSIVMIAGLALGFFISVAEPDLHILASQVESVTGGTITKFSIVVVVSIGIAVLLSIGLGRIVKAFPLYKLLTVLYLVIFVMAIFTSEEFLAISFDASGATTGAMTVPFIMALAIGVSAMRRDSKSSEKDSFGLVAVASTGAVISVMAMSIIFDMDEIQGSVEIIDGSSSFVLAPFLNEITVLALESAMAVLPIMLIFLICNFISIRVEAGELGRICTGLVYNWAGLTLFLTGVNAGFLDAGRFIGHTLAENHGGWLLILIGFVIGLVTILAEPAVHVLTHQIESVTSGYVKRSYVLGALSIGVGCAVALSIIRILIPELQLWHYLLPGYAVALALMYFVPKLFVGIAFDSGGVASGPMTATFILTFTQGAAESIEGADVLVEGFGVISMVAMTPIIALQVLGLLFKIKSAGEEHAERKKPVSRYECVYFVVYKGLASRILHFARKRGVSGGTIFYGRQTAKGFWKHLFRLDHVEKEVLVIVTEQKLAYQLMRMVSKLLQFGMTGDGITFSVPVARFIGDGGDKHHITEKEKVTFMYDAINIIVNKGMAEEMLAAAQNAGAYSGTIVNARGAGQSETSRLFSLDIEPEKELLLIVVERDRTDAVIDAVNAQIDLDAPGNGIMYVQEVSRIYGQMK